MDSYKLAVYESNTGRTNAVIIKNGVVDLLLMLNDEGDGPVRLTSWLDMKGFIHEDLLLLMLSQDDNSNYNVIDEWVD